MKFRYLFAFVIVIGSFYGNHLNAQQLDKLFKDPPTKAKPYVWWHWMGSNFSKPGITKDLEAMKAQGIGGATIFNIASAVQESHAPMLNNPWPKQTYRSPAYWQALRFAASEAKRLGLEIGLHNTAGYSTTGGPWIDQSRGMKKLVWRKQIVKEGSTQKVFIAKPDSISSNGWGSRVLPPVFSTWYKDIAYMAIPLADSLHYTKAENLTAYFDASGHQVKDLPKGNWMIYRLGYASTMSIPHPLPDDIIGHSFEADKMSREQSVYHWNNVLDTLRKDLKGYIGKSFDHMLIDSYEAGYQNWTPDLREEFIRMKGYDPLPWLLTFTDAVTREAGNTAAVGNERTRFDEQQTRRFDWDYKDVINRLYFEKGWQTAKQMLHTEGLQLQWEPYTGPFDTAEGAALADLPMAEFWSDGKNGINPVVPAAAQAAGKTVVGAEAFTGRPNVSMYTEDPEFLKPSAVAAFSAGINRLILHSWVHQPFDDKYQPGMSMGWWGTHFGRYQTWAEPGKAFFKFIARSQVMLQYGQRVSDYLCVEQLQGDADLVSRNDFLKQKFRVVNGKIFTEAGRSYSFMVFPRRRSMLPEVLQRISELIDAGATVVAARPASSPSMSNYPACDQEVLKLAADLWDNGSAKGKLFSNIEEAQKYLGSSPDYRVESADLADDIKCLHRAARGTQVYYVANLGKAAEDFVISFRQKGLQPELWQPEDGTIVKAPIWSEKDGRTFTQLSLNDHQSVFVVFRKTLVKKDHPIAVSAAKNTTLQLNTESPFPFATASAAAKIQVGYSSGKIKEFDIAAPQIMPVNGDWKVTFHPKLDGAFSMDLPALTDFSLHDDKRVKYFAGTAVYQKNIQIKEDDLKGHKQILLDLGTVNDIVALKVNGKDLGVLWYPPYVADITDLIKPGTNDLEISVTTNWANRLIGDEQETADFDWGADRDVRGKAMKGYPDWFIKDQPRTSLGRKTFTTWYYFSKDSKLFPAGLAGPVKLVFNDKALL